jgi:hypothetical protein
MASSSGLCGCFTLEVEVSESANDRALLLALLILRPILVGLPHRGSAVAFLAVEMFIDFSETNSAWCGGDMAFDFPLLLLTRPALNDFCSTDKDRGVR